MHMRAQISTERDREITRDPKTLWLSSSPGWSHWRHRKDMLPPDDPKDKLAEVLEDVMTRHGWRQG